MTPTPAPAPVYLTAGQVIARERISETTLWRWVKAQRFPRPRYTPGGHRRFLLADVEAWEAQLPGARP